MAHGSHAKISGCFSQFAVSSSGQVILSGTNDGIAANSDHSLAATGIFDSAFIFGSMTIESAHRTHVAAAKHGMTHHSITGNGNIGIAKHLSVASIEDGHPLTCCTTLVETIATAIHIAEFDALHLAVGVIPAFFQGKLSANRAAIDDNISVFRNGADITAAIHITLNNHLCSGNARTQQQGGNKECLNPSPIPIYKYI